MIDRAHSLSVTKQAEAVGIARSTVYYLPRPVSAEDHALMKQIDLLLLLAGEMQPDVGDGRIDGGLQLDRFRSLDIRRLDVGRERLFSSRHAFSRAALTATANSRLCGLRGIEVERRGQLDQVRPDGQVYGALLCIDIISVMSHASIISACNLYQHRRVFKFI